VARIRHTHGMAGFDQELTRKELNIPEGYALHAAVAIGKLGDKSTLPEYLQGREVPSPRKPLAELAAEGDFLL
ncbi:nitroreductase family protein, partial [Pseudomonas syringae pv. actinidiae]|nr:nitroreductase family protein [Pseudomonas syringae pv. actinidiae]